MASLFGQHIPTAPASVIAQSYGNRLSRDTGLPLSGGIGLLGLGIAAAGAAPNLIGGIGHLFSGPSYPPHQPYYPAPAPGAVPGQGPGSTGVQMAPLTPQPEPGQPGRPVDLLAPLRPQPAPGQPTQLNPPQQEWQPGQPIVLRPQPDAQPPEAGEAPAPGTGASPAPRPHTRPHGAQPGHTGQRHHQTAIDPHQRELNQQAQLYLERMGLDTNQKHQPVDVAQDAAASKLDGIVGPKTKESLESLRAQGIDPTKPITRQTIDTLKTIAEAKAAEAARAAASPAPDQVAGTTPPTTPGSASPAPEAATTPATPGSPAPTAVAATTAPAAPGALVPTPVAVTTLPAAPDTPAPGATAPAPDIAAPGTGAATVVRLTVPVASPAQLFAESQSPFGPASTSSAPGAPAVRLASGITGGHSVETNGAPNVGGAGQKIAVNLGSR